MLIGKLIKPCKICFYEQDQDNGEIESFSLLKLNIIEFIKLYSIAMVNNMVIEETLDNSIVIKYSGDDTLHQCWKELAMNHKTANPSNFTDVSKSFKSEIEGTSVLIRDPIKEIIRIAKREGNDTDTINRICISNKDREDFFYSAKRSKYFNDTGKYAISSDDAKIYEYWSIRMNNAYLYHKGQD